MPLIGADLELFKRQPLIRHLSPSQQDELARVSLLQRFPVRTRLFEQGQDADMLFIVLEGLVSAKSTRWGATTGIRLAGKDAVFPLGPIMEDGPCLLSVEVIVPSRIFMIPAGHVQRLARQQAAFAHAIAVELASGYKETILDLTTQKLTSATYRLGAWLLAHAQPCGSVEPVIAKSEIAQLIGTTPENLSRSLATLAKHGVSPGRRIEITDRDRLESYVEALAQA